MHMNLLTNFIVNTSRKSAATALFLYILIPVMGAAQTSFKFAAINVPGAQSTVANGINNANVIVGSFVSSTGHNFGFRLQNGQFTTINVPGSTQTFALGITDLVDVV